MYARLTQHLFVLILLFTVVYLNGCAALPVAAPTASPASQPSAEQAAGAPQPAAQSAPAAPAEGEGATESVSTPGRGAQYETVTAGVSDDNQEWAAYQEYLQRHRHLYVHHLDVSTRYEITVVAADFMPIHDAEVKVYVGDRLIFEGRSDAGGRLFFLPNTSQTMPYGGPCNFRVVASKGYVAQSQSFACQDSHWQITLEDAVRPSATQLDLLFLLDSTGSMGDEIDKLKASIADVADQIAVLPGKPDVRYGLVAYRDQGDAYVTRNFDFSYDLGEFQHQLAEVYADGGGDEPEDLNTALHQAIHDLAWRPDDAVRMIILVADAPPHIDYNWQPYSYERDVFEAVRQGIKIFPVAASNSSETAEYVFRQLAQISGGKFVFLTYEDADDPSSGPGAETTHDVENYSVNTLDKLIVKLVREELAKLTTPVTTEPAAIAQPSPITTPTTPAPLQPISCIIDLMRNRSDCGQMAGVQLLELNAQHQALVKITLNPDLQRNNRVRFDVTFSERPVGFSLNIGDSVGNDGFGGDGGQQNNDAEVQIVDGDLALYGNDLTPSKTAQDGHCLLYTLPNAVQGSETLSLEVSNERLGVNSPNGIEVIDSPYLFALANQSDRKGPSNNDIFAAFNRSVAGNRSGAGISQVVITFLQ
jgi:hypothetical protein